MVEMLRGSSVTLKVPSVALTRPLLPILPVAAAGSRRITLNTWDRFEVPLPLGRLAFLVEAPLWVGSQDRGPALEQQRQNLEARLNRLFRRSQNFFRQP